LMANVLLGREADLRKHELGHLQMLQGVNSVSNLVPQNGPGGRFSFPPQVHLIDYTMWGRKIDTGDSLVFNGDAVRPLYLITHE